MPDAIEPIIGTSLSYYLNIDSLQGGWSTRSFPHAIRDDQCAVLDNFMHLRDNVWTLRPGNILYGGGSGQTGSGSKILAMNRFYFGNPRVGQLCVHSGTGFYTGVDGTGAFTSRSAGMSSSQPASMVQMRDPDNTNGSAVSLFICDGSRVPQVWNGTTFSAVQTTTGFLPQGAFSGTSIKPLYVCAWKYNLVYANEPTDPCAVWISDTLRPERFTGTSFTDSAGTNYIPYYPGGQDSRFGVITGIVSFNDMLIIFFTSGVVAGYNTGSYGVFQFVFEEISTTTGCPSPQSIVAMDDCICFFGGDRFYATNGISKKNGGMGVVPLPDEIPTVYASDNVSGMPPEMANFSTVVGFRRSLAYYASYQSNQSPGAYQDRIVAFDTQANGGWGVYSGGQGGAWTRFPSGMGLSAAVECRGPGDSANPFFWGSSSADQVAQWDPPAGATTDVGGAAIAFEIRTKNFMLDRPVHPKTVKGIYPIIVFSSVQAYSVGALVYAFFDPGVQFNFTNLTFTSTANGTLYGTSLYGTFLYLASQAYEQITEKSYPQGGPVTPPKGYSFAMGLSGSATHPFNVLGFVGELVVDKPDF